VPHDTTAAAVRLRQERQHEQLDLIKQTCCKGASDEELQLFLWVARKHRLDPLTRQLHAVFRNVTKHHQDEKGIWVPGRQMTIQIGIDGYRAMAARYRDFGSISEPEYEFAKPGDRIPTLARIKVWKKGMSEPTVGIAYWDEYAPNLDSDAGFFWKKMPKGQLAKCAEALALRKAYPELSDIYTDDEMNQRDQDFTQSGRMIVDGQGFAPSGRPITYDAQHTGSREAAQKVAAEKVAGTFQPPKAEIPNDPIPIEPVKPKKYRGTIEIDHTNEAEPIVRGDIAEVLEVLQKYCTMTWKGEWWHILPKDVETIRSMCEQLPYKFVEILPKPAAKSAAPAAKASATRAHADTATAPSVVSGTIERANSGMAGKNPIIVVTLILPSGKKETYGCFDKKLFDHLSAGLGKIAHLVVTKRGQYLNIIGAKKIGALEFDADGFTPVVQVKDRAAGQKTLYGT